MRRVALHRGFIALISVIVISAIMMGLVTARAAAGLNARENALIEEDALLADAAAHACRSLALLAISEGALPQTQASVGDSKCSLLMLPESVIASGTSFAVQRWYVNAIRSDGTFSPEVPITGLPP